MRVDAPGGPPENAKLPPGRGPVHDVEAGAGTVQESAAGAARARPVSAARAWAAAALAAALLAACAGPQVRTERYESPDRALDMVVIVREPVDPKRDGAHEVFVDIGRRGDNPSGRYLHEEYRYLLKGKLDWRVVWQSSDMVTLHLFEHPPAGSKAGARDVALMIFVRDERTGMFKPLRTEEEPPRGLA